MTLPTYTNEQVDAVLDAYYAGDNCYSEWKQGLHKEEYREDMRRALDALCLAPKL